MMTQRNIFNLRISKLHVWTMATNLANLWPNSSILAKLRGVWLEKVAFGYLAKSWLNFIKVEIFLILMGVFMFFKYFSAKYFFAHKNLYTNFHWVVFWCSNFTSWNTKIAIILQKFALFLGNKEKPHSYFLGKLLFLLKQ